MTRSGPFFAGSYDVTWIDARRAELASLVAGARLDAARLLIDSDRHLDALPIIDAALDADPLLERGWRQRMTVHALLGDFDGVANAFRRCRSAVAEIGLEPSLATSELARTLRR